VENAKKIRYMVQVRRTQNLLSVRECWFESGLGHHGANPVRLRLSPTRACASSRICRPPRFDEETRIAQRDGPPLAESKNL